MFGSKPSFGEETVEEVEMGTITKWVEPGLGPLYRVTADRPAKVPLPARLHCTRCAADAARTGKERRPCAKASLLPHREAKGCVTVTLSVEATTRLFSSVS